MSVIAFLQDFKTACDACGLYQEAAKWLTVQHLRGPGEAAIGYPVQPATQLPDSVNIGHVGALRTYSEVVDLLS